MTLAVILGRFAIAQIFLGEAAASAGDAIELTATLLLVGATSLSPTASRPSPPARCAA